MHNDTTRSKEAAAHLAAWYVNVCVFAVDIERKLGDFERQLAQIDSPLVRGGGRVELHWWADEIRAVLDRFLEVVDQRLQRLELTRADIGTVFAESGRAPVQIREELMSNMVRDLDLRTILVGLLISGKHDANNVRQVVDLATQYADELAQRRAAPKSKPAPRD